MPPVQETTQPDFKTDHALWASFKKCCPEFDEKQFSDFPYWINHGGGCEPFIGIIENNPGIETSTFTPAISRSTDICFAMLKAMGYEYATAWNGNIAIRNEGNYHEFQKPVHALKAILLKEEEADA